MPAKKIKKLGLEGLIEPELVEEYLQTKKLKEEKKEKIAAFASLFIGLVFLVVFVFANTFFVKQIPKKEVAEVKSTLTIQNTKVVAGQPVTWTTLVKKSDIASGKYLLKLPKGAFNVKITTVSAKQAKTILKTKPKLQLSQKQRAQLAIAPLKLIKSQQSI